MKRGTKIARAVKPSPTLRLARLRANALIFDETDWPFPSASTPTSTNPGRRRTERVTSGRATTPARSTPPVVKGTARVRTLFSRKRAERTTHA